MVHQREWILVSAPNKAGELFISQLLARQIPCAAIVNNRVEQERVTRIGVKISHLVDTKNEVTWIMPEFPVGQVFLFENSVTLCCRYLQICSKWTTKPITIITHSSSPRLMYRNLGARNIIHTSSQDVSFLIASMDD
ncbi:hypothetical protein WMW72_33695 [Paenibacillus filicis]|uniref:Uncharacterized protein n=1 Tax=Paenibacillus filicis TaxID=669464 RepID=A0ABU9DVD7_9BACL